MTATEPRAPADLDAGTEPPVAGTVLDRPPARQGLPQVTKALGVLVGSTTVLSAILFYFGWSRAYYFYDYFGVDSSLLGLTTPDYLQLSVDGLFVPIAVVACAVLAILWSSSWWPAWGRRYARSRLVTLGLPIGGALLVLNGLSRVMFITPLNRSLAVAPLCLAGGAVLLVVALHGRRNPTGLAGVDGMAVAEWSVVFVMVGLSLFWFANDYSAAVGQSRAQQLVAELPGFPDATLYSEKSLGIEYSGVREIRCTSPRAAYGFRYDGLKLILQSGNQYLFLPAAWNREDGVAVLLPRTDTTRLEFSPSGAVRAPAATC